jgi:uncharacterized SAM-binding protein YcdF (DUF218 family)
VLPVGKITLRARAAFAAVVAGIALAAIWLLTQAGYYLERPAQAPEHADLVVILGGGSGERHLKAIALYKAGYAGRVLLTGMENGLAAVRPHYLTWHEQVLADGGVRRDALVLDSRSENTMEEALNTRDLMLGKGWRKVLVVTDAPHARRVAWAWRKAFDGTTLEYRIVSSSAKWWHPGRWWAHDKSAQAVITEYIKLVYYVLTK